MADDKFGSYYMDWDEVASYFGDSIPDPAFWEWLKTQSPEGYKVPWQDRYSPHAQEAVQLGLQKNVSNYAESYYSGGEGGEQFQELKSGLSQYEYPFAQQYIQTVTKALEDAGATPEDTMAALSELSGILLEGGLDNVKLSTFEKDWNTGGLGDQVRESFKQYVDTGQTLNINGENYKYLDGFFYKSGKRLEPNVQDFLTKSAESQVRLATGREEALQNVVMSDAARKDAVLQAKREYEARGKEWEKASDTPWALAPGEETRRPWDPSVREQEISEQMWNNPIFQDAYKKALAGLQPTELYPAFKGMTPPDTPFGRQAAVSAQVNIPSSTQEHTEQMARKRAYGAVTNPANMSMTARAAVANAPQAIDKGGGWGPTRADIRAREAQKKAQQKQWEELVKKAKLAANKPREFTSI